MAEMIELNGRRYRKPERPTVVICADGFDPAYVERGIGDGILPTIGGFAREGWLGAADAVVPTFTNPNNVLDRDRSAAFGARHCRAITTSTAIRVPR